MRKLGICILLCAFVVCAGSAPADNVLINYQGKLTDSVSKPIDGVRSITFRIYDAGGTSLWDETQSVTVSKGIFNVLLGTATMLPDKVFDEPVRYLGVTPAGSTELLPRQRIATVPYAAHALNTEKVGGFQAEDFVKKSGDMMTGSLDVRGDFRAGTHSLVYRDLSGFVGIGTETPAYSLDVAGTVRANSYLGSGSSLTGVNADLLDGLDSSIFARVGHDHWGETWSGRGTGLTLNSDSLGLVGAGGGKPGHAGVLGTTPTGSRKTPGMPAGVWGDTDGGFGVIGTADGGTGVVGLSQTGAGMSGYTESTTQPAITGRNPNGNGIEGRHGSVLGLPDLDAGVYGSSSTGPGVYGKTDNISGEVFGGLFEGNSHVGGGVKGVSTRGYGVLGVHTDPSYTSPAVHGQNEGSGNGVLGDSWAAANAGVLGRGQGGGPGVEGTSGTGPGGKFSSTSGNAIEAAGTIKADNVAYNSPRTHYYAVASSAFFPVTNVDYTNGYGMGGAYLYSGSGGMHATVDLPQGAIVTSLKVYFNDTSSADVSVTLQKQYYTGGYADLASVSSSGISGYMNGTDPSIDNATINKLNAGYMLYAYSMSWSSALRIMGAVITYTVSEAD